MMLDDEFALSLQSLEVAGDIPKMREMLKTNGGMKRLIALAVRGATVVAKVVKPRAPRPTDEPEGFAEFYAAFPRHVARSAAAHAYRRAVQRVSAEALLAAAKRYGQECAGKDAEFIKHPATWLNGGCWADEPVGLTLVHLPKPFEPTNLDGWIGRLEIFHGLKEGIAAGGWQEEWGGRPGTPECKVPPEALRRFQALHPRRA